MSIRPGTKLRSAVSPAEVVVVRPPSAGGTLQCGGHDMVDPATADPASLDGAAEDDGLTLGKRYTDEPSGLEVLCTKSGAGVLTCDGRELVLKGTKPLPSSD